LNFKWVRKEECLTDSSCWVENFSGPLLVSRTGDVGCSNRVVKVPNAP